MSIKIHMLPALSGDCFLIDINQKRIIIDGGYSSTYKTTLKHILHKSCFEPIIELVVVTHIDRDHIEGVIELLKDDISVKQIWFNTYRQLPKKTVSHDLTHEEIEILRGYKIHHNELNGQKEISAAQGMALSHYIEIKGISLNSTTEGSAICLENIQQFWLSSDIKVILLSPKIEQLSNLAYEWLLELRRKKWTFEFTNDKQFDAAMEAFLLSNVKDYDVTNSAISNRSYLSITELAKEIATPDKSITNASSISFILEYKGKRLLFLGDVPEDQILDAIEDLQYEHFDVIKVAHHGSLKNANSLFDRIDGEYFLISTNGSNHEHPHKATIAKIISRPTNLTRKIVFNYPHDAYKHYNDTQLMETYNYSIVLTTNAEPIILTTWDSEEA